ncbi:MAG: diacylglycerol/lipid kinase family protein [Gemmatimonadales bacterium]
MKRKRACLIINPRGGKNVAKLPDLLAVFSAAGWKTDLALKQFGGHTIELASDAAEAGYDLVIAYGGDGTLNQVINGVMAAKGNRPTVGLIPGGTANVWAHQIGLPDHPVKAALGLVDSEARKVDLGRVELAASAKGADPGKSRRPSRRGSGRRTHFLLMAGLGVDAAALRRVSTPLKEKIGAAAVAVSAVRELTAGQSFPIEVRSSTGSRESPVWKGDALQVVIGNTRSYGNIVELTPNAFIDDGLLELCVITAGGPLTTLQEVTSLLLHRKPRNEDFQSFQGAQFRISVPAHVALQLDGSSIARRDLLSRSDREAGMVTYRFDARPGALSLAIPNAYDDSLFVGAHHEGASADADAPRPETGSGTRPQPTTPPQGRRVTVVGAARNPHRKTASIVAGTTPKKSSGESKPVAVRIEEGTTVVNGAGEPMPVGVIARLPEGSEMVVEGRQSKRGVIRAKRVLVTGD